MSSSLQIQRLGQVAVTVRDVPRAVAFYRDALELPLLFQAGNMAFFAVGGLRLLLSVPEKPEFDHPASTLYYTVPDIHAAYELLLERGVEFRGKPHPVGKLGSAETWMAFCSDPDGNLLAIMSEVPLE
ncbi:VOC family protein [Paenibacillus sp. HJGM_3]|uniref:VOC family protein n=1 Tax=Paenibacillus sp. HJGM_3 TaxID=3379816 RepID=UPI003859C31A